MQDKVVITGMGTVSPLGFLVKESLRNAFEGVSDLAPITLFDASNSQVQFACEVKGFKADNYMSPREARRWDRFQQFALAATRETIQQAGLELDEENKGRVGVIVSLAIGELQAIQDIIFVL